MQIHSLKVEGAAMTLSVSIANRGEQDFNGEAHFGIGALEKNLSEIYILDAKNKLRLLPARDSKGECVCDHAGRIPGGEIRYYTLVFGAAAEGVNEVSIIVPRVGAFEKVPVTR